ncbi:flagellar assembly protein FliX [Belnapia moabensis]|uniref:flagellar assembly protein FliX n=1 Tax=Belnapia moabensis TaxID=365533 RepID=UPI0005B88C4B|nr:flagellar assembly protein FliX [Belnapia moabensis]
MQGIGRLGGIGMAGPARGKARGGAGGFRIVADGGEAAREAAAAGGIALAGLGLFALQEHGSVAERSEAAQRRASDILAELTALQCDMLGGSRVDPVRLQRLVESGEEGADPVLREVVQGVVLRAQVELMRRSLDGSMAFA